MTRPPIGDTSPPRPRPEHGCWAGGCIGGPVGGILLPIVWYFEMIRDGIDFDIVASLAFVFYVLLGIIIGILLGSTIGSIIYYVQRYRQRDSR